MMKTFFSFVNKEVRHILRDRRTMLILFGMPLVMMLLFGFAISTDVRNVRLVVVTTPWDNATQQIVHRLDVSEYFVHTNNAPTVEKAKQLIRDQKADLAVVFSPRFAHHRSLSSSAFFAGVLPQISASRFAYQRNEDRRCEARARKGRYRRSDCGATCRFGRIALCLPPRHHQRTGIEKIASFSLRATFLIP